MKKYKHIFFDLDHTLWDFDRASMETLKELFYHYKINEYAKVTHEDFVDCFWEINHQLWDKYNHGLIDKATIRDQRFFMVYEKFKIDQKYIPTEIGILYLEKCPQKPYLMPFAEEILSYLRDKKYQLHILSNGFGDVQSIKLEMSNIAHFFDCVITSETTGHKKPSKEIFDYAIASVEGNGEDMIMIGDNPETDIMGAINAGWDTIFYNPQKKKSPHSSTIEVKSLEEIKQFF
ncbi:YjjG family noncanonical pyrimidine nucleotidase [Flexithrix dorotheae]|uniref:YjjG family noncanonical pyrimidine nucleotidase n=1 Tax=Flexithrix dorotheae TaxID=70993 RepID=UPI0003646BEF|nr:YjjG family noncanonical pyrimidine nucleotidase [Flexithrix dorotheae]